MTDPTAAGAVPPLPGFVSTLATALAQKAFTALAVALTAHGLLAAGQSTALAEDLSGVALIAVSMAWTWAHSRHTVAKTTAAVATAAATGVVPAVKA